MATGVSPGSTRRRRSRGRAAAAGTAGDTDSAMSPNRPRRTDGADGSRVTASSTAPVADSATAAVGRQSGCSHSMEIPTDSRPRMPDTRPTSTSVPVRYWRVRSMTTRQHMTARTAPATPERDRERRDQHQQQADRGRDRDQDLVRHPRVGADPRRVDLVGVGGDVLGGVELVDGGAGGAERQPREDAAGHDDQGHGGGEHDGRVEGRGTHDEPGGQEDGADHDGRDDQGASLTEADQRHQSGDQRTGTGAGHGHPEDHARRGRT